MPFLVEAKNSTVLKNSDGISDGLLIGLKIKVSFSVLPCVIGLLLALMGINF